MKAIAVDDEKLALESLRMKLTHIERISEVHAFLSAQEALDFFQKNEVDIAFLDISMAELDGIALANRMRQACPGVVIIFVTGYSEYALDALKLHADGYLMKPMDETDIENELDNLERRRQTAKPPKRIRIQCFGNFEVFVDGRPMRFEGSKTRELLAYLVDRHGSVANTGELCAVLWEDEPDTAQLRKKLRKYISYLTHSLQKAGAEELLIKHFNSFAVAIDAFDCDYYDYLSGEPDAAYRGEYLSQYSWAETTLASLEMN